MEKLRQYLAEAEQNHFRLLVVPDDSVDKEKILFFLQNERWDRIDINKQVLEISEKIPAEKRRSRTSIELENWLNSLKGDKFVVENITILFSPEMGKIDPIRLFKYFSRDRSVVLFFPGRFRPPQAEFSLEGRPDHMMMDISEVLYYEEGEAN